MDVAKLIKEISEKVNQKKAVDGTTKETVEKKMADTLAKMKEENKKSLRKIRFEGPEEVDEKSPIQKRILNVAKSDVDKELQKFNDDLLLTSVILKQHPRSLNMWREFEAGKSELSKAMATASGSEGEDWIPTGFSADLISMVQLELKVAALFRTITMPTNPYKIPVQLTDGTAYLQSEAVDDASANFRASTPTTSNLTLTAVKLAARNLFSEEVSEDSIVPILPFLKANIVKSLAIANEKATINGDESGSTSGSHMDSNVTAVYDSQVAWDGLRHAAIAGTAEVDISTPALETIRSIRTKMGVYGVDPSKLVWITGISGYIQMLSMKDSNSVQVLTTIDKYGPSATILSGELAKFDGSPVIVSEYIYQNLNATGVYDGVTATKTILLCVYVPGHIFGDRRRVTVKQAEKIESDQQVLVVTERKDFTNLWAVASNNIVGQGYNLTA